MLALRDDFFDVERVVVDLPAPEQDFVDRLVLDFEDVRPAPFDFDAPLLAFVDLVVDRLELDFLLAVLDFDVPLFALVDLLLVLPLLLLFADPLFALVERVADFPPLLLFADPLERDLVDLLAVFEERDFFAVDFVAISVAPVATVRAPKT